MTPVAIRVLVAMTLVACVGCRSLPTPLVVPNGVLADNAQAKAVLSSCTENINANRVEVVKAENSVVGLSGAALILGAVASAGAFTLGTLPGLGTAYETTYAEDISFQISIAALSVGVATALVGGLSTALGVWAGWLALGDEERISNQQAVESMMAARTRLLAAKEVTAVQLEEAIGACSRLAVIATPNGNDLTTAFAVERTRTRLTAARTGLNDMRDRLALLRQQADNMAAPLEAHLKSMPGADSTQVTQQVENRMAAVRNAAEKHSANLVAIERALENDRDLEEIERLLEEAKKSERELEKVLTAAI